MGSRWAFPIAAAGPAAPRPRDLGPDDDVPALFHLASVLSFPSLEEGFGLVALEALAAGLPLVASARPPLTEFLDASVATLVDPSSERAIANGLLSALSAPAERAVAGRRRAAAYSWGRVAAISTPVARRIAAARGSRPRRTSLLWAPDDAASVRPR